MCEQAEMASYADFERAKLLNLKHVGSSCHRIIIIISSDRL